MNFVTDTWRGLVQRRLWPLAVALALALLAVPLVLSKDSETEDANLQTASVPANPDAAQNDTVVSIAGRDLRERNRRVLGSRKNPFRPAVRPTLAPSGGAATGGEGEATTSTSDETTETSPGDPGVDTGTGGEPPAEPRSQPRRRRSFELYQLSVRFGSTGNETLPRRTVRRLKALPSVENPVVIYLGVLDRGRTAVFLVDSGVVVQGDGNCEPSPDNCQTLHLKEGETAFLDVQSQGEGSEAAQYQLDLLRIRRRATRSASAARRAYSAEARGGRRALRPRLGRASGYVYDRRIGTLKRLNRRALRARMGRSATR